MRKRIFSFALLLVLALTVLVGCGSEKTYGGYSKDELEGSLKNMISAISEYTSDDITQAIAYFEASGDSIEAEFFKEWGEIANTQGELLGYTDFSIDQTGKTYTVKMQLAFEQRDAVLTVVYKAYNMEVESMNVEPVYTVGEKMSKAALNTIMGIGIVFVMLLLISLVIKLFEFINKAQSGSGAKKTPEPEVAAPSAVVAAQADDDELIAVIAAAIAAATGRTTDDFVVRTIKRR